MSTTVDIWQLCQQDIVSGGVNTPPEARLLLYSLAKLVRAKDIIETGYDAGYTTRVLAQTGATVLAIDDGSEYPEVKQVARDILRPYSNVVIVNADALSILRDLKPNIADLIFIDDLHNYEHVKLEAIECRRLIRPGGIVAFHDTNVVDIHKVISTVFHDWEYVTDIPCYSPYTKMNYGIGFASKPRKNRNRFYYPNHPENSSDPEGVRKLIEGDK
jgi:SAM-dependent methyltransferase